MMASRPQKKRPRYSKKQSYPPASKEDERDVASPYMKVFQLYREELDSKHDKHERLVKLSRDCTIHSKKIIFLLHRIADDSEKPKVLSEAEEKFGTVLEVCKAIASELIGEDPDKYHTAYTPGMQEFIEAIAYFTFLKTGRLITLCEAQEYLTFPHQATPTINPDEEKGDASKEDIQTKRTGSETAMQLPLDPNDFVLGVADLTGELMRMSINAVGSGNRDLPFDLLPFVRAVFCGFHSLRPVSREIPRKLSVLRSSLAKIEQVCYTLKIRGSEIPKHMLAHVINTSTQVEGSHDNEMYDTDSL